MKSHRLIVPVSLFLCGLMPAVAQTDQLPGIAGTFGKVHEINANNRLYFTLVSAEYSVHRFSYSGTTTIPNADQKLLVLRFTVQNPQKREVQVTDSILRFVAVTHDAVSYENAYLFGKFGTKDRIRQKLLPAQKVELTAAIVIPGDVSIPKLVVLPMKNDPGKVIRYSLDGKVKTLAPLFADDGYKAKMVIEAPLNQFLPMAVWDVSVPEGRYERSDNVAGKKASKGFEYASLSVNFRNGNTREWLAAAMNFHAELVMGSGEVVRHPLFKIPGLSSQLHTNVAPGGIAKSTVFFQINENDKPVKLRIWEHWGGGASRVYEFALADGSGG